MRAPTFWARVAACFAAASESFDPSVGTRMCLYMVVLSGVGGAAHHRLEAAHVEDADVLLLDGDEVLVLEAGEEAAHRLEREAEVAADLLAGHAQVELVR